eukprot:1153010-Pelagomonas_calceolata.AAC.1
MLIAIPPAPTPILEFHDVDGSLYGGHGDELVGGTPLLRDGGAAPLSPASHTHTHLYLNSVTLMAPCTVATEMNLWKAPRCSGMVVTRVASVVAPTLASSATRRRRSKFMFAPLVMATTVLPCGYKRVMVHARVEGDSA